MNNSGKTDAFKSYFEQAKAAYNNGEFSEAKDLFLKAATLANEISLESTSYNVRMEYHSHAERILNFLKNDFGKSEVKTGGNSGETSKNDELTSSFNPLKSNEKTITFKDVAGLEDVKDAIRFSVIEPLKNPEIALKYDINPGAKILLYGPPGTGKTYIAKAIAGELDAAFYAVSCQDLISKYMGDSSKRINDLFDEAQKNKNAIIFFDEFDSVASKRDDGSNSVDGEVSRFVSTFLTKIDGVKKSDTCEMLLLIAATNRPWSIDKAMLRGGRFDTHIYVGLPDSEARRFLIEKEFKKLEFDGVNTDYLITNLEGFGCADIVAICKKIKQLAYRRELSTKKPQKITLTDVLTVLKNSYPSTNEYDLEQFKLFKNGEL